MFCSFLNFIFPLVFIGVNNYLDFSDWYLVWSGKKREASPDRTLNGHDATSSAEDSPRSGHPIYDVDNQNGGNQTSEVRTLAVTLFSR